MELKKQVDVCVVGAGHAGCEAALACARLGLQTVIFTVSVDSIALMPCNPNVGGSSKGHLVRELDALGGEMGKNIDKTFIQSKMLNVSKGPAVHSLRAQADKAEYSRAMRKVLENQDNLLIKQAEVCELLWEETEDHKKKITGVKPLPEPSMNVRLWSFAPVHIFVRDVCAVNLLLIPDLMDCRQQIILRIL